MKCRYCGQELAEGVLYCSRCKKEVCIVPEYNPLDDVLAAQIKGSIDGTHAPLDDYEYVSMDDSRNTVSQRTASRNTGNRNTGRNSGRRNTASRNTAASGTGRRTSGRTGVLMNDQEQKRRQAQRKKALKKKRRKRLLLICAILLVLAGILGFVLYQNSYSGLVSKGNKSVSSQDYDKAQQYYEKAVKKKPQRPEAYTGLSKIYIAQNDLDTAENVFLDSIDKYPNDSSLYRACIEFYVDTKQESQVSVLLDDAEKSVRSVLSEYISKTPTFSLDASETYDDVQQLTLTTKEETIYYTTDGSDPTTSSTEYTEPLQIEEGETVVKAISVNKKGIPSLPKSQTYTVQLPIEDAPAVTPSTGQYDKATQISINVPDGYVAYYTTDKSDPTTESTQYTEPIDMPEGTTIFKAVLVNAKGRMSGVTTRNYELAY